MSNPESRDWMIEAWCRGQNPRRWETDRKKGPKTTYARQLCAPCKMHQQCAIYALGIPGQKPSGVIVAGISMRENTNSPEHREAMIRLRQVAEGDPK